MATVGRCVGGTLAIDKQERGEMSIIWRWYAEPRTGALHLGAHRRDEFPAGRYGQARVPHHRYFSLGQLDVATQALTTEQQSSRLAC